MASPIITPLPVQTDTSYRPISRMAVVGLILAVPSVFIFASENLSWLLLAVVLPAVILCTLAWRTIRNSEGNLAGETLAVLGLVISVGSGLGWITMTTVASFITESEARAATDDWIAKMQRGEAGAAFLMRMPPSSRRLDFNPEDHAKLRKQFPGQQQEASEFDGFLLDEICGQILRYGTKVSLKYDGLVESKTVKERPIYRFRYLIDSPVMKGSCVITARADDYNAEDGIRRDWILSIEGNLTQVQFTKYGEMLRSTGNRATEEFERFMFAIANDDLETLNKLIDPKNTGELQIVIGYIRPKEIKKVRTISIRKPLRLRKDSLNGNMISATYECTALVDGERAIDFSVDYNNDVNDATKSIMQNCRFLGTRKMATVGTLPSLSTSTKERPTPP